MLVRINGIALLTAAMITHKYDEKSTKAKLIVIVSFALCFLLSCVKFGHGILIHSGMYTFLNNSSHYFSPFGCCVLM